MKKPEKKNESRWCPDYTYGHNKGYNQACSEWEKWLPTKGELHIRVLEVLIGSIHCQGLTIERENRLAPQITKAIMKRLS